MIATRHLGLFGALATTLALAVSACDGSDDASSGPDEGPAREGGARSEGSTSPPPTPSEFGLDVRPKNTSCKAPPRPPTTAPVVFERVFNGVVPGGISPMMLAQMPGDPSRIFLALRDGKILAFDRTNPGTPKTAATLSNLSAEGEGGLLGFAFHPKCTMTSCRLYVSWTRTGGPVNLRSEIGYFTSTNGADFGAYKAILGPFDQPYNNHNGGGIAFSKEGFLFVSFGDGGLGHDPDANGQRKTGFFSKVLRIDVDNVPPGERYGIPTDNPFAKVGGQPETFAYGFRNPFRLSVDRATGDLWAGDVGQSRYEEIDRVEIGGNYGWPCREGKHDYPYPAEGNGPPLTAEKCPSKTGLLDPVAEYANAGGGRSITGGVVYRGNAVPAMVGNYVYGDYKTKELFSLSFDPATGKPVQTKLNEGGSPAENWVAFSEDLDGEIYALSVTGPIWKMGPKAGAPASTFPDRLSKTGCVDPADPRRPAEGLVPFGVSSPLWSDDAEKERFLALPGDATIEVGPDGDFALPQGTVLVKTFHLAGKPIETRLFIHHDDGVWGGYSYEWLDDGTDAVLLPSSKRKAIGSQSWFYPSRSDCVRCHTEAAGRSLGLEIGQLNGDFVYPSTNRLSNQLTTLEHIGLLSLAGPASGLARLPGIGSASPVAERARAYLHSNCSSCHRPEGGGGGAMDLRYGTDLAGTKTCNAKAEGGEFGVPGSRLLVPRSPGASLLSIRPRATGAHRMPPLGSSIVDTAAMDVVDAWIGEVSVCP